jgi:hypothetical protein
LASGAVDLLQLVGGSPGPGWDWEEGRSFAEYTDVPSCERRFGPFPTPCREGELGIEWINPFGGDKSPDPARA